MLNKTQKTIIIIAVILIAAMVIYPPWVIRAGLVKVTIAGQYDFIWAPQLRPTAREYEMGYGLVFIDLYRLSIQLVGVLIIATGLCLVCGKEKDE